MAIENQIARILLTAGAEGSALRPTELYNEGWLLRLILDRCSREAREGHTLHFLPGAKWASEGLLPSQFGPRRGFDKDPLSESRTHADGIIGHFLVGLSGRGDVALAQDAEQLVVVEAKLFSLLSAGTKNAPDFDQAARNVACMAELLARVGIRPERLKRLGFFVAAPREQIDAGLFAQQLLPSSLEAKVAARVQEYGNTKNQWLNVWFLPALKCMSIRSLPWEDLVAEAGPGYRTFYERCLHFNRPVGSGRQGNAGV